MYVEEEEEINMSKLVLAIENNKPGSLSCMHSRSLHASRPMQPAKFNACGAFREIQ